MSKKLIVVCGSSWLLAFTIGQYFPMTSKDFWVIFIVSIINAAAMSYAVYHE